VRPSDARGFKEVFSHPFYFCQLWLIFSISPLVNRLFFPAFFCPVHFLFATRHDYKIPVSLLLYPLTSFLSQSQLSSPQGGSLPQSALWWGTAKVSLAQLRARHLDCANRVTIARAMANNPKILLLDEPTGDLDSTNTLIVMDKLLQLNREGITIVMVCGSQMQELRTAFPTGHPRRQSERIRQPWCVLICLDWSRCQDQSH